MKSHKRLLPSILGALLLATLLVFPAPSTGGRVTVPRRHVDASTDGHARSSALQSVPIANPTVTVSSLDTERAIQMMDIESDSNEGQASCLTSSSAISELGAKPTSERPLMNPALTLPIWSVTDVYASPSTVRPGDTVRFTVRLKSGADYGATRYIDGAVKGYPHGDQYCNTAWTSKYLPARGTGSVTLTWTVPLDAAVSSYGFKAPVWTNCTTGCYNTPCYDDGCCGGWGALFYYEEDGVFVVLCPEIQNTPYFTHYYGNVTINESPAPARTIVQALNPRGDTVGCFTVTTAGLYGYMRVYGEDTSSWPHIPGMRPFEPVTFKVNGQCTIASPAPVLWQDDKGNHTVNLSSPCEQEQRIPLHSGWNWFSIYNSPSDPSVGTVLASIAGKYSLVLGEDGVYKLPPANPIFNTLPGILPAKGYMIYMTQAAEEPSPLLVTGAFLPDNTPISLHSGWNWLGCLPERAQSVSHALGSITGKYDLVQGELGTYAPPPADPRFNTLSNLEPRRGYLIRMTRGATLVYPLTAAVGQAAPAAQPEDADDLNRTPYFTHYYGSVTAAGLPAPAGAIVEALSPRSDVVGSFQVKIPGFYGYMRVYGEDASASPPIPGMRAGETMIFRIHGNPATAVPSPVLWQDDKGTHEVSLRTNQSVSINLVFVPLLLK